MALHPPTIDSGRTWGGHDRPKPVEDPRWQALPAASKATVGVIDTGIALRSDGRPHQWFGDHLSYCPDEDVDVLPESAPYVRLGSADGHGTFVTGLILLEAPDVRVRMWGVIGREGTPITEGTRPGPDDDRAVAAAIRLLAINPNVAVINLSFGGGVFVEEDPPPLLRAALRDIDYDRVAVVASAGNDGSAKKAWPAAFKNVIAVGALDDTDHQQREAPPIAAFSNWGGWIRAYASGVMLVGPFVDFKESGFVLVEGEGFLPSDDDQPREYKGWAQWSGTSFAAATVSGRIAHVAQERNISGARAAKELLDEAPTIHGGAWIKSSHSH
jgi:subtilisin family serine protease